MNSFINKSVFFFVVLITSTTVYCMEQKLTVYDLDLYISGKPGAQYKEDSCSLSGLAREACDAKSGIHEIDLYTRKEDFAYGMQSAIFNANNSPEIVEQFKILKRSYEKEKSIIDVTAQKNDKSLKTALGYSTVFSAAGLGLYCFSKYRHPNDTVGALICLIGTGLSDVGFAKGVAETYDCYQAANTQKKLFDKYFSTIPNEIEEARQKIEKQQK